MPGVAATTVWRVRARAETGPVVSGTHDPLGRNQIRISRGSPHHLSPRRGRHCPATEDNMCKLDSRCWDFCPGPPFPGNSNEGSPLWREIFWPTPIASFHVPVSRGWCLQACVATDSTGSFGSTLEQRLRRWPSVEPTLCLPSLRRPWSHSQESPCVGCGGWFA